MSLEQRTFERISKEFSGSDEALVIELLNGYSGPEIGRVIWDILELSKGSLESVRQYLQAAQIDYRDVLYWAEYYDTDPMFCGRDPKQMVNELTSAEIDLSDCPEITPEQFAKAVVRHGLPIAKNKAQVTLRIDSEVLEWFKAQGRGYQTQINSLLRAYMEAHH